MINEITIFCPATVANVACGFDVLGFCLDAIGDTMIIRKTKVKGLKIIHVEGFNLSCSLYENVAGVSALAIYEHAKPNCGFEIEIYKHIKPGSGIGSSAASAMGSVFGINVLLGHLYNKIELTNFAMKGEALASKSDHADNLAPIIYGGFTLVRNTSPLDILQIPIPKDLYVTIIHPQIEVKTSDARNILPDTISLKDAITQWANLGSFIHALHTSDYKLMQRSLNDVIIEPHRKQYIPYFDKVKSAVLESGALGCAISGSGPSIFALSKGKTAAKKVEKTMQSVYYNTEVSYDTFVSTISSKGIHIINL